MAGLFPIFLGDREFLGALEGVKLR